MRRIRSLTPATDRAPLFQRVACLGFFDGLHRGHRKLLRDLKAWARESNAEPAVVTFDRHPQSVLGGRQRLPVLTLEHRLLLLEREGVAVTLALHFDREISTWSPETFVSRVFREALGANQLLLGFDSAFGHRRRGTYDYLKAREQELGLEVRRSEAEYVGGKRVSSTLVRDTLAVGDLPLLETLLDRRHSVLGRVVHGDHRGRKLGFPTANLDVRGIALPPPGVYFAEARPLGPMAADGSFPRLAEDGTPDGPALLGAIVNIGRRPTISSQSGEDPQCDHFEVHLLDFNGDLYDEHLEVVFVKRHRAERKFATLDDLVKQIHADVAARRQWGHAPPG